MQVLQSLYDPVLEWEQKLGKNKPESAIILLQFSVIHLTKTFPASRIKKLTSCLTNLSSCSLIKYKVLLDLLLPRILHFIQHDSNLLLKIQLTPTGFLYLLLVKTPGRRKNLWFSLMDSAYFQGIFWEYSYFQGSSVHLNISSSKQLFCLNFFCAWKFCP